MNTPKDLLLRSERPANWNYAGTSITRPPNLQGKGGHAWSLDLTAMILPSALIGCWIFYSPVNPMLDYYVVMLSHLRDIDGMPKAHKQQASSAYELGIHALNPEQALPDLDAIERGNGQQGPQVFMFDVAEMLAQFDDIGGDAIAVTAVENFVQAVVSTPPDETDARLMWGHLLTAEIVAKTRVDGRN